MLTSPLATPNRAAKTLIATVWSASAQIVGDTGGPPSTNRPSSRRDTQRLKPT